MRVMLERQCLKRKRRDAAAVWRTPDDEADVCADHGIAADEHIRIAAARVEPSLPAIRASAERDALPLPLCIEPKLSRLCRNARMFHHRYHDSSLHCSMAKLPFQCQSG